MNIKVITGLLYATLAALLIIILHYSWIAYQFLTNVILATPM